MNHDDDDLADPWDSIGAPRCPRCLLMLDYTESRRFECRECGLIRI